MITKGLGKLNAVSYIETISTKNITNNEIVECLRSNYGMSNWDEVMVKANLIDLQTNGMID